MRASAVILHPKDPFIQWVKKISESDFLKRKPENIYFNSDSPVWIIPSAGTFKSEDEFGNYINLLKPKLLLTEIHSVTEDDSEFQPFDVATFDRYFDLEFHSTVVEVCEL